MSIRIDLEIVWIGWWYWRCWGLTPINWPTSMRFELWLGPILMRSYK